MASRGRVSSRQQHKPGFSWLLLAVAVSIVVGAAATLPQAIAASWVDSAASNTKIDGHEYGHSHKSIRADMARSHTCDSAERLLTTMARLEALMDEVPTSNTEGALNKEAGEDTGQVDAKDDKRRKHKKGKKTLAQQHQHQHHQQRQIDQQEEPQRRGNQQQWFAKAPLALRLVRELQLDVPAVRALIAQQCQGSHQRSPSGSGTSTMDTPSPVSHRPLQDPAVAADTRSRVRRAPANTTASSASTIGTSSEDDNNDNNGTRIERYFPVTCELAQLIEEKCQDPGSADMLRIRFMESPMDQLDLDDKAGQPVHEFTQQFSPTKLVLLGTIREPELRFLLEHGVWASVTSLRISGLEPASFDFSMLRHFSSLRNITLAENDLVSLYSSHNHTLSALHPDTLSHPPREAAADHGGGAQIAADTVAMLGRLSHLNASFNSITQLDSHIMLHLHNLSECWLEFNQIREIPARTFQNLSSLTILSLENNRISRIDPDAFLGLAALSSLGLGYNALSQLNTSIFQPLKPLRELFLEANPLETLNPELFRPLTKLETFQLTTTRVKELPHGLFAANTRLKNLYLFRNRISKMDGGVFDTLTHLQVLDLSNNRIVVLPRRLLAGLVRLKRLALNNNAITHIEPGAFAQLHELRRLDVQINQLSVLDNSMFSPDTYANLEDVEASMNMIDHVSLQLLEQLPNLKALSLSDNRLTSFLPNMPGGSSFNLKHLRLSKNPLREFPSVHRFPMLVELEVRDHKLPMVDLTPLAHLQHLTTLEVSAHPDQDKSSLYLDADKVTQVIAETGGELLRNLKRLDLRNLRLDGARSFDLSQLQLTHLRIGWPGVDEATLPVTMLCSAMDEEAAEELDISNTGYTRLALCDIGFDTVLLLKNPKLKEVVVHTHVQLLNVSGCSRLESVSLPSAELLDISGTKVKPDPGLCAGWGSRMLFARNWLNTKIRRDDDAFRDLLARCLRTVDLIDVSNNRWLNRPDKVTEAAAAVTVLSSQDVFTENAISLRTRTNVPVLVMMNTPINCRLQLSNVRGRLRDESQVTRFAFWYDCGCQDGYVGRGGDCRRDRVHVYATVFSSLAGLVVLQALAFVAYRYVRQHRHLQHEHDLKVQLLEERDEEVLALKQAWEIEYSELHGMTHLATGAFGVVYKAEWDTVTVAVKVMQNKITIFDDSMQREFEKEVEFLQRTRHPHVVRFFGAGTDPKGNPFLVLEFVALGSLKQLLLERDLHAVLQGYMHNSVNESGGEVGPDGLRASGGRVSVVSDIVGAVIVSHASGSQDDVPSVWALKQRLAHDVACGMAFIHSLNHVHRDLKSGNVLVSGRLRAKITDFGSIRQRLTSGAVAASELGSDAVSMGDDHMRYSYSLGGSTMHLSMTAGVGTPMYMAPEALYGRAYDQKADVYSFGVLLWEIATQQHPDIINQEYGDRFDGPLFPTLLQLLREEGKRLRFPNSTASHPIPTWFKSLATDCMAAQPDDRPAFSELVTSLT